MHQQLSQLRVESPVPVLSIITWVKKQMWVLKATKQESFALVSVLGNLETNGTASTFFGRSSCLELAGSALHMSFVLLCFFKINPIPSSLHPRTRSWLLGPFFFSSSFFIYLWVQVWGSTFVALGWRMTVALEDLGFFFLCSFFFFLKRGTSKSRSSIPSGGREDSQRHFILPLVTSLAFTLAAGFKPETFSFQF